MVTNGPHNRWHSIDELLPSKRFALSRGLGLSAWDSSCPKGMAHSRSRLWLPGTTFSLANPHLPL